MKKIKTAFPAVLMLIVLVLAGCYMDTSAAPGAEPIFLQPRDLFDDFGTAGHYVVVRMYETAVMDSLLNDPESIIYYEPGNTIYYEHLLLPQPEMIYAAFLVDGAGNPPPSGRLVVPYVPAGSYRFIVERGFFDPSDPYYDINFAGITGAFSVNAGEDVEINIALDNFGGV